MLDIRQIDQIYADKLKRSGSHDEARKTAYWRCFEAGVKAMGGEVSDKFRQTFMEQVDDI